MNYYDEIKNMLIDNEIYTKVKDYAKERNRVITYYEIGKLLYEAGNKYGQNIISQYSEKLQVDVGKKYTVRYLRYMRQFYEMMIETKRKPLVSVLTWSHYTELLTLKNAHEIDYYIDISIKNNLSKRELREKIKNKEYERLPLETRNKLINDNKVNIKELVPSPILIRNKDNIEIINEKILHKLVLEDIEAFMNELGKGFCFIGSEYKLKLGDNYNYIDLLLFNIDFNCYVVIELKTTSLKKEHLGQIQVYMNYIDINLRKVNQDKTIGIIICKKDNKFIIEYCSDERIIVREYKLV